MILLNILTCVQFYYIQIKLMESNQLTEMQKNEIVQELKKYSSCKN